MDTMKAVEGNKPSVSECRVEIWEERDRLHIGVQIIATGEYVVSWFDEDARQMFEDGFFKSGRELESSVMRYALEHEWIVLSRPFATGGSR